nr:MAG TPA: hypothetical protein [Caudoviricetes sp.]
MLRPTFSTLLKCSPCLAAYCNMLASILITPQNYNKLRNYENLIAKKENEDPRTAEKGHN